MRSMLPRRVVLWLGLVVAAASAASAALPTPEDTPQNASLAGQLLVASPDIGDPRFRHAVILMVRHDKSGALGIIVNHPLGEQSWASVLDAVGEPDAGIAGNVEVFAGGPVQPWLGFIVHSAEYRRAETIDIDGRVAMTASIEILRDLGQGKGPHKSIVAFGYTGWGPGQLEGELARHGWFTIPEDSKLVFDEDRDKVWNDARALQTIPL